MESSFWLLSLFHIRRSLEREKDGPSSLDPLRRATTSEVVIVRYKCRRPGLLTPANIISSFGVEPKGLLNQGRNHCAG